MKLLQSFSLALLGVFIIAIGCTDTQQSEGDLENTGTMPGSASDMAESDSMAHKAAVAVLHPTEGNNVSGTVTFEKVSNGVRVNGEISGLEEGKHGFHIHQYGNCSAPDGTSAGGHYNPAGNEHGARTDSVRHMGDMGNITAGSDGNASVNFVDSTLKMNKIFGRAVIVHGGEDDLTSQPSGAAGPRMSCGVIGIANPDTLMNQSMQEGNN